MVGEIERQRRGEADETAKCDEIEEHEPAAVGIEQQLAVGRQGDTRDRTGGVPHREDIDAENDHHGNQQRCVNALPAPMFGDGRREQGVEHDAHVAGAGNAHDDALQIRRIPAAGLRQGYRKGGAAEAQNGAEHRDSVRAGQAKPPDIGAGGGHDSLRDGSGQLRTDRVGHDAKGDAQDGARKHGNGDEGQFLLDRNVHCLGDIGHERAERDPGHEADVEIEEGGEQSRPVAGLLEVGKFHFASFF